MAFNLPTSVATPEGSAITGGLAGILSASVFGGPVGLAVGLGAGLLSERFRRNELDILADDYDAVQQYGSKIQQQSQVASDYVNQAFADNPEEGKAYQAQISSIADDAAKAQGLAQHYDPNFRAAGTSQLVNTGAKFDALYKDVAARTQHFSDQQYALEQAQALHYQSEFETAQSKARDTNALANRAQYMLANDKGVENEATKAILMQLAQISPREANANATGVSLGVPGIGINMEINKFKPTYQQAMNIIEGTRATTLKSQTDYMAALIQSAHQQGYTFAQDSDGKVSVKTINSVVQNFKALGTDMSPPGTVPPGSKPAEPGSKFDPAQLPTPAENAGAAVKDVAKSTATGVGDFLQGIGVPRLDNQIQQGAKDTLDNIQKYSNDALQQFLEFRKQNRQRIDRYKQKRTNQ